MNTPSTHSSATSLTLTNEHFGSRSSLERMIASLKDQLDTPCPQDVLERTLAALTIAPGADSAASLRPLVKCLPRPVAERLPDILKSAGAPPTTAVVSFYIKDIVYRLETAIFHGNAFLCLTDLRYDPARPLEWI